MKKILTALVLLVSSVAVYAQKDVTKFLGIPIDGTKSAMIQKLKTKGFRYDRPFDRLEGQFNGTDVQLYIVTNNNKVCRVLVCDSYQQDEANIKIRFNKLCQQFLNNKKYMSIAGENIQIPESENISYEIAVNKKRYQAGFCQLSEPLDSVAVRNELHNMLLSKYSSIYTEEQLANPSEELQNDMDTTIVTYLQDKYAKKSVWFMIDSDSYGEYRILMFYDNEYNRANGEDL